jgi:hypothetical protein
MIEVQYKKAKDLYPNSNWVEGKLYNRGRYYMFQAKIFPQPSEDYGIDGGHVSKLWVKSLDTGKVVADYERGYGETGAEAYRKGYLKELLDSLTQYAIENSWQ